MAVCGWCWICGYKFDGLPGEAVTFACDCGGPPTEHKICRPCHAAIDSYDDSESDTARELVTLLLQRHSAKIREEEERREPLREKILASYTSWAPRPVPGYVVEPVAGGALHSGRDLWSVRCLRCGTVVHEATTGPEAQAAMHVRMGECVSVSAGALECPALTNYDEQTRQCRLPVGHDGLHEIVADYGGPRGTERIFRFGAAR